MFVNRVDAEIICKKENMDLVRQYRKKFGVQFPAFNYVDFPGSKDKFFDVIDIYGEWYWVNVEGYISAQYVKMK